jgi:hypothetical protein
MKMLEFLCLSGAEKIASTMMSVGRKAEYLGSMRDSLFFFWIAKEILTPRARFSMFELPLLVSPQNYEMV